MSSMSLSVRPSSTLEDILVSSLMVSSGRASAGTLWKKASSDVHSSVSFKGCSSGVISACTVSFGEVCSGGVFSVRCSLEGVSFEGVFGEELEDSTESLSFGRVSFSISGVGEHK